MKKSQTQKNNPRSIWKKVGPGFVTGSSDNDPSGVGTYSAAGAQFGFRHVWLTLYQLPFMIAIQEMCGRIGLVTGRGLVANLKKHVPAPVLITLVVALAAANIFNIGANIAAMSAVLELISGQSAALWSVVVVAVILVLEVFVSYRRYAGVLKWIALSLLSYAVVALLTVDNWGEVFYQTIVPQIVIDREYFVMMVAFLGTTISPYLFFWQTSEEVEEEVLEGKLGSMADSYPCINREDVSSMKWDTVIGMLFSQCIAFFIVITSSVVLHANGIYAINSAADAAAALTPLAGAGSGMIFSLGIIGSGLLGIPVLAGSLAYGLSDYFGWNGSLGSTFAKAKAFYGVIIVATVLGLLVTLFKVNAMKMLVYAALINGIVSIPMILFILWIANRRDIMGHYINGLLSNIIGTLLFVLMLVSVVFLALI